MQLLSLKRAFKKCTTRGGNPKGRPQMPNLLRFGAIFRAFQFSVPPPSLLTLFSYLVPIPVQPASPLPEEVNKKLSYRRQNTLSVMKTPPRQYRHRTYTVFIRTASLDWLDA